MFYSLNFFPPLTCSATQRKTVAV